MKWFLLLLGTYLLSFVSLAAQQVPSGTPSPQSTPIPQVTPMYPRGTRAQQLANTPIGNPNEQNAPSAPEGLALSFAIVQQYAVPLYRKPTGQELLAISPSPDVLRKFREFLKRPKSGIFRLVVDAGCSENTKVITATDDCLKYTMPGEGSSFSFRTGNYRIQRLADLTLNAKSFHVTDEMMHGIMANLGDVPLESVGLQSPGVQFIAAFQPAVDIENAQEIDKLLVKGVQQDGYSYGRAAAASKDTTYVLRVIAYKGSVMRSVNAASYDELDFDKRNDTIVAFRTVDIGSDGSFTIIWTELSKADAPKITTKKSMPAK